MIICSRNRQETPENRRAENFCDYRINNIAAKLETRNKKCSVGQILPKAKTKIPDYVSARDLQKNNEGR